MLSIVWVWGEFLWNFNRFGLSSGKFQSSEIILLSGIFHMLLSPGNSKEGSEMKEKLKKKGIPVVSLRQGSRWVFCEVLVLSQIMFSKTPSASGLAGFEWPPSICDLPARVGSAGRDPGLFGLICCFLKTNATFHPLLEIFTNTTPEALKKY